MDAPVPPRSVHGENTNAHAGSTLPRSRSGHVRPGGERVLERRRIRVLRGEPVVGDEHLGVAAEGEPPRPIAAGLHREPPLPWRGCSLRLHQLLLKLDPGTDESCMIGSAISNTAKACPVGRLRHHGPVLSSPVHPASNGSPWSRKVSGGSRFRRSPPPVPLLAFDALGRATQMSRFTWLKTPTPPRPGASPPIQLFPVQGTQFPPLPFPDPKGRCYFLPCLASLRGHG